MDISGGISRDILYFTGLDFGWFFVFSLFSPMATVWFRWSSFCISHIIASFKRVRNANIVLNLCILLRFVKSIESNSISPSNEARRCGAKHDPVDIPISASNVGAEPAVSCLLRTQNLTAAQPSLTQTKA